MINTTVAVTSIRSRCFFPDTGGPDIFFGLDVDIVILEFYLKSKQGRRF
jgi:hypothetical protein